DTVYSLQIILCSSERLWCFNRIHTANATLSPLINTTHHTSTPSGRNLPTFMPPPVQGVLKRVLTWYILLKTGVFLIGSTIAALKNVCRMG
ncbi:hypothetical protein IRJ41_019864, partial [Triplophysa rosa]